MDIEALHFILTYTCNYECDHCFLYCSPSSKGVFSIDQLKTIINDCNNIPSIKSLSFEGGEPFLYYPLLLEIIKYASKGYETSIETNCYWATTVEDAFLWLKPLKDAGLLMLEISDDSFHTTKGEEHLSSNALVAAEKCGLNVYAIRIVEPSAHHIYKQDKGKPIYVGTPKIRGRAVDKLTDTLPNKAWDSFTECPLEDLKNPSRLHIDPFGNVHLCQGLTMGNTTTLPLSRLISSYDPYTHPIVKYLVEGGPSLLAQVYNTIPEDGYVDACHLCSKTCLRLIDQFPQYLTPRQVYGL